MAEQPPAPGELDSFVTNAVSSGVEGLYDPAKLQRLETVIANAVAKGATVASGAAAAATSVTPENAAEVRTMLDAAIGAAGAWIMSLAVENTFDVEVSQGAFAKMGAAGDRTAIARAITGKMVEALTGGGKSVEPSSDPAARYLETVLGQTFESWAVGTLVEIGSCSIPFLEQIQTVGDIGNRVANALGFSDSSSRVLRPYIDNLVVEPLRRKIDMTYRPTLLSPASAVRQFMRGRWEWADVEKELAQQGLSAERIDAILNEQRRFFSAGDVRVFVDREHWSSDKGIQHLRDQGYSEEAAIDALRLEGIRRLEQLEASEAAVIIGAYVDRRISGPEFRGLMADAVRNTSERNLLEELAGVRLAVNHKSLSPAEARACVKAGILAVVDYRAALRRDGYDEPAVLALELLLRHELDEQKSIDDHRRELDAQRAAEKAVKDATAAVRTAQIAADRALARRGDESDLERAAIRGLIPFARVEELYRARYDADTVDVLVDLLEQARSDYLEAQEAAADARRRGGQRNLDVGTLERAYLAGVLTADRIVSHPTFQQFSASDQAILLAAFETRKREQDAAAQTKADATAAAERKGIDLGRLERLVRLGARTLEHYDTALADLGFTGGAIADMRELLEREIAIDEEARRVRAAHEPRLREKGLSLEQFRRAVVLGTKADTEFEIFLKVQGFTEDARAVLLADVRAAVADAESARQRREQPQPGRAAPALSLARVAEAARLGLISSAAYADRLRRDGYSEDDIALEMELFLAEVGDVQTDRTRRDVIERELVAKGLSLEQLARAVRVGLQSLEAYQARAIELGYGQADVAILVRVLGNELRETQAAKARRDELAGELEARSFSLAELEAGVLAGVLTVVQFIAELEAAGLVPEDAELLGALLVAQLEAARG